MEWKNQKSIAKKPKSGDINHVSGQWTWKTDKRIESMLRGFKGRLLRRLLGFNWEDKISNIQIKETDRLGRQNKKSYKKTEVDWTSTQDEKEKTTKTSAEMDATGTEK
jgi:hypothetical protein